MAPLHTRSRNKNEENLYFCEVFPAPEREAYQSLGTKRKLPSGTNTIGVKRET